MSRSLDVGAVIRRVFDIYVDQAPVLMPAAAVVFVFTGILTAVLVTAAPALALLAVLIGLVATTLFTGMVVELVADVQDGRRDATVGQLLRAVTPVIGQLILVAIVAAAGVLIGLILLIIPGLILITIWSVAAPVVVLERPGVMAALARSRELVRGNGWQVFGVILVLDILVVILASAIELAADSAGSGAGIIVRVIVGVLTAPLSALAAAVLYFELGGAAAGEVSAGAVAPGAVAPEDGPTGAV
ncbi:MAG: YciC family protein [Solirubrobacterales bacterium]